MKLSGYLSFLAYCLLHSLCYVSFGQTTNVHIKRFTENDGLYNKVVFQVLQDQQEFIWMRTQDGLYRYDGARLEHFQHEPYDSTTLYSSYTTTIYEDRSGTFWVSTAAGGVQYFDKNSYSFKTYPLFKDSLAESQVDLMYEDREGLLWLPTNKGLYAYDKKQHIFIPFHYRAGDSTTISSNSVTTFFEDKRGNLWIGTLDKGLNKFNRQQRNFTRYQHKPDDPASIGGNNIYCIYETRDSILWIGADYSGGLNALDPKTGKFTRYMQNPGNINSGEDNVLALLEDKAGILWIGTWNSGLIAFDRKKGTFTCYQHDSENPASICSNTAWVLHEDKTGTLWVGTYLGSGLQSLNKQTGEFTHYVPEANNLATIGSGGVAGIVEDRAGSLWVISMGSGVSLLARISKKINVYPTGGTEATTVYRGRTGRLWVGTYGAGLQRFNEEKGNLIPFPLPTDKPIPDAKIITRLLEDKERKLWAATEGGLRVIDEKNNHVASYQHDAKDTLSISSNNIRYIYEDAKGTIWICTDNGLNRFNKANNSFVKYKADYSGKNPAANNIRLVYEDRKGLLWIGTEDGIAYLDKEQHKIQLCEQNNASKVISRYRTTGMYDDGHGTLWISTFGAGLAALDIEKMAGPEKKAEYIFFTKKDGLPTNIITRLYPDDRGNLWMSSLQGICRFTPSKDGKPQVRNYNKSDGLQELSALIQHKDSNGWFYLTDGKSIITFHPDRLQDNPYIPPIVLTDFELFNKPVPIGKDSPLKQAIGETKEITLPYDQSTFSLGFAALNYIWPEKNQYAYRLEGFEKEWNYVGNEKVARYVNVPPGTLHLPCQRL
jgi:ligand-binding sensor domain-containing protein